MGHDFELISAEYLLGNLDEEERLVFEESLAHRREVQIAIENWDGYLSEILQVSFPGEQMPVVPEHFWRKIDAEIRPAEVKSHRDNRARLAMACGWIRRSLAALRKSWSAGFATGVAVAATLAVWTGVLDLTRPLTTHYGQLTIAGQMVTDIRILSSPWPVAEIRSRDEAILTNASLELWLIEPGAEPVSLGVLGSSSQFVWLETDLETPTEATIAISREPLGGSPDQGPSGPVLASANFVAD